MPPFTDRSGHDTQTTGLVLVQNDHTAGGKYDSWEDVLGERYHFPNQYKNKVKPGTLFVYYRGVRRSDGKRGQPEYFGCGRIGDVWRDQRVDDTSRKALLKWYCAIEEYVPFARPVPAKSDGTATFEDIPENFWGVGVRTIDARALENILREAGVEPRTRTGTGETPAPVPAMPAIDAVAATLAGRIDDVLAPQRGASSSGDPSVAAAVVRRRRSRFSKLIGDRGEEIIWRMLESQNVKALRWCARDGVTPGWDIEFIGDDGEFVAVEVKGTSADAFTSFDVTAAEWAMARQLRGRFRIALVARCLSTSPLVFWLNDPLGALESGALAVVPAVWRITLA